MKQFLCMLILLVSPAAFAKTVASVNIAPQGAVLQSGSTLQFSASCTYSDATMDDCTAAGGVHWSSSRATNFTVSATGLAKAVADPGPGGSEDAYTIASVGSMLDRAAVYIQHPGDTWYQYMTPDVRTYRDFGGSQLPVNVVVGATIAVGTGFVPNTPDGGATGTTSQGLCSWSTSSSAIATVDRQGLVTALAPGTVTVTCGRSGNGVFGTSNQTGWVSPGNTLTFNVVNGGTGNATWYVRPKGGTPFTNAIDTPNGQCDGLHDADYPGSGVNQPCAFGNIRYLWSNETGYSSLHWMIAGGDTVIVRQKAGGYSTGLDNNYTQGWSPGNCHGNAGDCYMPSIPSGTATHHTRILGENYASCHSDAAKTLLNVSWFSYAAINVRDSQFVDVACFEMTDKAQCAANGNYANTCTSNDSFGGSGVLQSALTASVNLSDLFIHGLTRDAISGAAGVNVVADHIHIRAMPDAGINMDDDPWLTGNISVAGGYTLTNSITEFTGCVEEYPIVHNYPYIECRDQQTGGYGDGLGTASTVGDWVFDHDVWRFNFQDGLDLLHSGMHSLSVTNSQSYGNDGQQYKIGSGQKVVFQNNIAMHDCQRVLSLFGDEPASAIIPGVSVCRAAGDGIVLSMAAAGSDTFQNNTYVGYGATSYDLWCESGYDACPNANTTYQNNINLALLKPTYSTALPGLFYDEDSSMPANSGWAVRDHNLYYNFRGGCPTLAAGEICADPGFVNEPSLTVTSDASLDNFNFNLSATSPAKYAGTAINGLTLDNAGSARPTPPSMGALEFAAAASTSLQTTSIALAANSLSITQGQTVTLTATASAVNGAVPTGTVSFTVNGTTLVGTLSTSGVASVTVPSLSAGTYPITASYAGSSTFNPASSNALSLVVNPVVAPSAPVSIAVGQPQYGFNVIPGSTRRIFATVTNGSTNQVNWSLKAGAAKISSTSGAWIDVTAPATGSACQVSGSSVMSATQFTVEATSQDDATKKSDVTFNVCNPGVQVAVVPAYRTLYANQTADVQSLIVGSVNDKVQWTISSQPQNGDGKLVDSSSRDTIFSASVAGRYVLTATSQADTKQSSKAILYVTGHTMPYRVTRNLTEPVDCSVDPALLGSVYEVGPSQTFKRIQDVPLATLQAGSTIRVHNEDTSGTAPTVFNEYLQLAQSTSPDQPVRLCGVPDFAGNLPIIDATNATGRADTTASVAGTAVVTVGGRTSGSNWPTFNGAQNIAIEGIHIRNARTGVAYTSPAGTPGTWQTSAACVNVGDGHNISIVGNDLDSCGNGAASAWNGSSWGGSSLNHLWEGNYVHGNGSAGSAANHQMYLQGWGQVVQFNRIDRIAAGTAGANLKSRGLQDVIRYNYFGDGSARDMDLVDVQGAAQYMSFADFFQKNAASTTSYSMDLLAAYQEAWNTHFSYGNVYLNSTSTAPIHFAYDQSAAEPARKGSLYWYSNTFYETLCSLCSGQTWSLFDSAGNNGSFLAQTEFQTIQAFNNVLWMDNPSLPVFQWNDFSGFIGIGGNNLMPVGWGTDTLLGGLGDGWNATANSASYQGAGNLSLHVTGFDTPNILTTSTLPFDKLSWLLTTATNATTTVPTEVCEMPTRFAYLPNLGYYVPRTAGTAVGATDSLSQTSALINPTGGTRRVNTPSATCQ